MEIISTNCPGCGGTLEFPPDFDNVICSRCGASFRVRRYGGALNLSPVGQTADAGGESELSDDLDTVESALGRLDDQMSELELEIESIKSREQAVPLQIGCALFGVFGVIILLFAFFMTVGKSAFGTWLFYAALVAAVALGWARFRRRLSSPSDVARLREERARLEDLLERTGSERARVESLRQQIIAIRDEGGN